MTTLAKRAAAVTVPEYSPLTARQIAALTVLQYPHTEPAKLVEQARKEVEALESAYEETREAYKAESWEILNACDRFTRAYIGVAAGMGAEYPLGHPDADHDRDSSFGPEAIHPDSLRRMVADCQRFQRENAETLQAAYESGEVRAPNGEVEEQAGYDFYHTRNHAGVGFWEDGDWPEAEGEKLTAAAHKYGETSLTTGDDGAIYLL